MSSLGPLACAGVAVALLAAVAAGTAQAAAPTYTRTSHVRATARIIPLGHSIGSPTNGRLVGGAHLDDADYLRIVPFYQSGDVRWGLGSLVLLLDDAARSVRHQFPDAVMSVGHLSRKDGGDVDRHASHESGRDADIGFYIKGQTGHPLYSDHFVAFRGDGTAPSWPGAYFDDARNWTLVSALVSDPHARVTYLFVATPIRARLMAYAERIGAPLSVRVRASELMAQPRGSLPHDDHFHVRIACPEGAKGCVELPTTNPRRGARHRASTVAVHPAKPPVPRASEVAKGPGTLNAPPAPAAIDNDPADGAPADDDGPPAAWISGGPAAALVDDVDGPVSPAGTLSR